MKRIHALEWEDLKWFPQSWRDYGTDYLRFIATRFDIYRDVLPLIKKGMEKSRSNVWVDCASGGGSGIVKLAKALKAEKPDLKIILTDFYPNIKAFERTRKEDMEVFEFEPASVDARSLPPALTGKFRTMFGAFHHFKPQEASAILQNALDTASPVAIFEPLSRTPASFFSMLFVPLNVLIFTIFIRPVHWKVLPFIYLLPIVPLYILWDGIASILRMYTEKEMRALVDSLQNSGDFHWEIGRTAGKMPVYYLIGFPREGSIE